MTLLPPLKYMRSLNLLTDDRGRDATPADLATANVEPSAVDRHDNSPSSVDDLPDENQLLAIGAKLRHLRQQQGLSVEEVSARTQIQPRAIAAIEAAQIDELPESVYVKGMVKRYADSMGLNGSVLVRDFPTWQQRPILEHKPKSSTRTTITVRPQVKPLHLYLGYGLLLVAGIAGISQVLNNSVQSKPSPPIVQSSNNFVPKTVK